MFRDFLIDTILFTEITDILALTAAVAEPAYFKGNAGTLYTIRIVTGVQCSITGIQFCKGMIMEIPQGTVSLKGMVGSNAGILLYFFDKALEIR